MGKNEARELAEWLYEEAMDMDWDNEYKESAIQELTDDLERVDKKSGLYYCLSILAEREM